ncbi:hypothetical protein AB0G64_26825 [Streptomyces longwoodensis]|uniref:hypothetical protein n=1 Tax=Streptomyces longwoodensis TaxID=68231 RepID=UPI0034005688
MVVVLLILGIIVPKYVITDLKADRDKWREAFDKEREAHQLAREQPRPKSEETSRSSRARR